MRVWKKNLILEDLACQKKGFQHCYQECEQHLQLCVASKGNYFEGDHVDSSVVNKQFYITVTLLFRHTLCMFYCVYVYYTVEKLVGVWGW
jgi:hypothetical protein